MMAFYKQRFANAADFTFFFVGAFKVDEVTKLLATYLGSLPSSGTRSANFGDMRLQFPTSIVAEKVTKGQEPRSQTVMSFFADTGLDELETHRVQAATSVLEMRLAGHPAREAGRHVLGERGLHEHVAAARVRGDQRAVRQRAGERGEPDRGRDDRD
jgi:zinc protease